MLGLTLEEDVSNFLINFQFLGICSFLKPLFSKTSNISENNKLVKAYIYGEDKIISPDNRFVKSNLDIELKSVETEDAK